MKIIVAGGTGFIGQALVPALINDGHEITVISRKPAKEKELYHLKMMTWDELKNIAPDDYSAVINLAGENIGDKRWSIKRKQALMQSRIQTTKTLVNWLLQGKEHKCL